MRLGILLSKHPNKDGASNAIKQKLFEITEASSNRELIVIFISFGRQILGTKSIQSNFDRYPSLDLSIGLLRAKFLRFLHSDHSILSNYRVIKSLRKRFCIQNLIPGEKIELLLSPMPSQFLSWFNSVNHIIGTVWDIGHIELRNLSEFSSKDYPSYRNKILFETMEKSTTLVTESNYRKEKLTKLFPATERRIEVIPLLPLSNLSKVSVRDQNTVLREPYVIYPAASWTHKNHKVLFEAMQIQIEKGLEPRLLVLTGEGSDSFQVKIRELGIEKYVRLMGRVQYEHTMGLIDGADVLLMPSHLGPTNLPPLEALHFGTPVAVSDSHHFDPRIQELLMIRKSDVPEDWEEFFDRRILIQRINPTPTRLLLERIRKENVEKWRQVIDKILVQ